MKKVIVLIGVVVVVLMTGCSHNVGTAFNGRVINIGYDPELNKFGIQYYSGLMVTGVVRENSEVGLEYNDNASIGKDTQSGSAKATFKYSQKVGKQITGYYVDAVKAGATPEQLDKYTSESEVVKAEETKVGTTTK